MPATKKKTESPLNFSYLQIVVAIASVLSGSIGHITQGGQGWLLVSISFLLGVGLVASFFWTQIKTFIITFFEKRDRY